MRLCLPTLTKTMTVATFYVDRSERLEDDEFLDKDMPLADDEEDATITDDEYGARTG